MMTVIKTMLNKHLWEVARYDAVLPPDQCESSHCIAYATQGAVLDRIMARSVAMSPASNHFQVENTVALGAHTAFLTETSVILVGRLRSKPYKKASVEGLAKQCNLKITNALKLLHNGWLDDWLSGVNQSDWQQSLKEITLAYSCRSNQGYGEPQVQETRRRIWLRPRAPKSDLVSSEHKFTNFYFGISQCKRSLLLYIISRGTASRFLSFCWRWGALMQKAVYFFLLHLYFLLFLTMALLVQYDWFTQLVNAIYNSLVLCIYFIVLQSHFTRYQWIRQFR